MDPDWIVLLIVLVVVILIVAVSRGWWRGGGTSTAGHYDPDAIGGYTLDPATMTYRYHLPTLARSRGSGTSGGAPPHRRRRRRKQPSDPAGG